ncbi:glycosyltransferase family 2 protein [Bifidobacterium hominis]|uniref:glycosyltransferase family 2 protein n=1 Tax=Bifidobacterium hominis TaxID=3133177 RepID=UPI003D014BE5
MWQKVSIIVPVYNVERYLKRCIDSLIKQSYPNIEIILVDDGSTDNSFSFCKEYALKDSRIRVFHKENEGLGLTRNYGIERALGEYVTFVDSDDYLTLDAIESMLGKATATNADVVIATHYYKNEEQKVAVPERLYSGSEIEEALMVHMMGNKGNQLDALSYTAWGKLYKKDLFIKNNLCFPSERKLIWEDLAFSIEAYPLCKKVYVSHKPVYYYCFNEGSLTHTYKPNKLDLVMELYRYLCIKIQNLNFPIEAQYRLDTNFVGHIRTCIKLEVFYANANGFGTAIQNIRKICSRGDVQKLIRSYPKTSFSKVQYIYNFAMEHKWVYTIYFLTWLQNKKKRIE